AGNPETMLEKPNTMVMTESAAKEMFGDEDPINKTVGISHMWATDSVTLEMQITAIVEDLPSNTHMRPKYIANIFSLKPFNENMESRMSTLTEDLFFTNSFFVCNNEEDIPVLKADLQAKINASIEQAGVDIVYEPIIRKVTDVHFDKSMDWSIFHKSADRKYVTVFITIAIMILLVACINYMNMATARSAQRAREVGLRKTFGSIRGQLFIQFMMESFVLVLLSSVIAIFLVFIVLPYFNSLSGKTFVIADLLDLNMLSIIAGVIFFVTFVAGSYPALYISGFEPATVLKGKFVFNKSSNFFRKFLTVIQFAVSLALLISTVVVIRQMNLMRYSKLNEAGNQIISIRYGGFNGPATVEKYQTFKNFLLQDPDIKNVTLANHLPRLDFFGPIAQQYQFPEVSEERYDWSQLSGDYDFPETFDLKLLAGRFFDHDNTADSNAYVLNEAAVSSLNLTPEEAISKSMLIPQFSNFVGETDYENAVNGSILLYMDLYGKSSTTPITLPLTAFS
ncbi:MAG: FtsX-like permease family protein, partial [Bacteroidota bacterium]